MAFASRLHPGLRGQTTAHTSQDAFEEISASASGITWVHTAGKSPDKHLPETSGAGCAFIDYDNDGWMDIYLVNSAKSDFYTPLKPLRNALYHNNRDGTFTDVTEKAGVTGGGYGMGVAVGDYNGDGFPDLYVTQYGRNILYRNNGDGTFTDVTDKAGVAAGGWSSSAVWFDYDNDGKLDLFVCQFAEFDPSLGCGTDEAGVHHYCIPRIFKPRPSWLFHNNGDGTFTDVSKASGIADHLGKAWGVVATDLNNDGKMDLFVANDTVGNFLYLNHGDKFEEVGLTANVAYSDEGRARSGMGVDSADFNQDGWMDLFVANIDQEIFSLYRNNGDATFDDKAMALGVGMATRWMSGWGLKFLDYDNDGELDLILANGFPDDLVDKTSSTVKWKEPLLLFHNDGKTFRNVSAESGPVFTKSFPARGLAIGDFNNDGAIDVLVSNNDAAPLLLKNNAGRQNHWLGIHLVGRKSNPDAIGARVSYQAGDMKHSRMKVGGGSFLSAHDPRILFGLGQHKSIDWVEVTWPQPSRAIERFTNLPIDRYITLVEGAGKWT
ncbi:CRTAC1 family protein [Granulicella sp. L46]|uniref:CRTAC1 family protein n=1 Tax=Granulicella sp. L46 TaxID=1641865 RepID=UPI00131B5C67|nr:CRTAC1 family protein [Granulicella sp. L46]